MEIWSVVVFCKNTEDFVICHKDVLLILINELFDKCLRVIGKEEMMNDTSSFALFQGNFINFLQNTPTSTGGEMNAISIVLLKYLLLSKINVIEII